MPQAHPGRGNARGAPENHAWRATGRAALRAVRRPQHRRQFAAAEPGATALRAATRLGRLDRRRGLAGQSRRHGHHQQQTAIHGQSGFPLPSGPEAVVPHLDEPPGQHVLHEATCLHQLPHRQRHDGHQSHHHRFLRARARQRLVRCVPSPGRTATARVHLNAVSRHASACGRLRAIPLPCRHGLLEGNLVLQRVANPAVSLPADLD